MSIFTLRLKRWLRNLRELWRFAFVKKGLSDPDNHIVKLRRIRRFANQIGAKSFIETGTFYGQTTEIASRHFNTVVSIELSPYLAELNARSFKNTKNVTILQGDSRELLLSIVKGVPSPILFWLDGHYSGGITAGETSPCPILEELSAIRQLDQNTDFCLLIDDRRLFNGNNGYPEIDYLTRFVFDLWPDAEVTVDGDATVISLKNEQQKPSAELNVHS